MIRREVSHIINGFYFLKNVDVLFFSGGGQLNEVWGGPWVQPYAMMKWAVPRGLTGAKPIFLSVGFGSLDTRLSRFFTRTALSLAAYRSYRDPGSRDLMKRAGFHRDDPVYPDLAYSLLLDGYRLHRDGRPAGRVVGVSPFSIATLNFRGERAATIRPTKLTFARWYRSCSGSSPGIRVSMFTSEGFDRIAVDDLWAKLTSETSPEVMESIERHEVSTVRDFLEHAAAVDVMVASRLHGVLLSQLAGTPCSPFHTSERSTCRWNWSAKVRLPQRGSPATFRISRVFRPSRSEP